MSIISLKMCSTAFNHFQPHFYYRYLQFLHLNPQQRLLTPLLVHYCHHLGIQLLIQEIILKFWIYMLYSLFVCCYVVARFAFSFPAAWLLLSLRVLAS
jgi:hypothetical protein